MHLQRYMFIITIVILGTACISRAADAAKTDRPNIVLIISDDLSWGDLGCYGQKQIETPHIDRLAAEGMRFMNAYAGNSVCAPSRSCLMQGLHPGHARVRGNSYKGYREGLWKGDVTVAEILQDAGYATGLFGKWGLGLMGQPDAIPNRKGFDTFFGYLNQRKAHSYFPPFLWDQTRRVNYPAHAGHNHKMQSVYDDSGRVLPYGISDPTKAKFSFNEIHSRSLDFIRDHQDEPFFLYLAHTLPHGPAIAPDLGPYRDKPWAIGHKEWAAMVSRLDQGVGDVMALLEELNIDKRTLILFASDNGHSTHGYDRDKSVTPIGEHFNSFGPTRGRKGDSYDGAFRVPAIARWPGMIKPGSVSDHIWAFWDFLPTAAEVAGIDDKSLPSIDGISFRSTLLGKPDRQVKHDYLYWEYNRSQAIRMGDWFAHRASGKEVELYDLSTDPQQRNDVAVAHAMLVRQIRRWMDMSHTPSDVWPTPGETEQQFQTRLRAAGIPPRKVNIDG